MIAVNQLGKRYGAQILFSGVTLQFNPGQCYGIVGANGSGKSTFLKILTGEEESSDGDRIVPGDCKLGFLRQDRFRDLNQTIIDVAMGGDEAVFQALTERDALLARAEEGEFETERYAELEDILQHGDGYTLESRAAEVLEGLGIPASHHRQSLSTLSGGFQLRVLLAQTLTGRPDVLLLDEPTNHLDIISIRWLEKFIGGFSGIVVVVSHDRHFLDSVCTTILDVDYATIVPYTGNYRKFVESKEGERDRREKEIAKQEKEIADQQAFIDRFKAKATKARQAQSKQKQLDKITVVKLPTSSRRYPNFKFEQTRPSGKEVLKTKGLEKSFGEKRVLTDVNLEIRRADRLAVIGPNGIGKSTLLKILVDRHRADAGEFDWGHEVAIGFFPQDHRDALKDPSQSTLEYLWSTRPGSSTSEVRGLLGRALFSGDDVDKKVGQLSGGEAARLLFSEMMGDKPNVLILDEPTNHLDLEAIDALIKALKSYDGTLIFVSHDRHFVSSLATRILELKIDGAQIYNGSYDEYLGQLGEDHLDAKAILDRQKKSEAPSDKKKKKKDKDGPRKPGRQKITRELKQVTKRIETLEAKLEKYNQAWDDPAFFTTRSNLEVQESHEAQSAVKKELEGLMSQWEKLEQALDEAPL